LGFKGGEQLSSKATVEAFLAQPALAVVGVSRNGKKFGNRIYEDLRRKGYRTFAVNPNADLIGDDPCYPNLTALPERIGGVVFVVPPEETEKAVKEVADLGIRRVWMQQGSESQNAIRFCEQNDINVVAGECILMFAKPVESIHRLHHWIWRILGKLPK
jgi:predicted CoA-binding protein